MPIAAEMRELYPPEWPEISLRIREERAGWRCESTDEEGRRCEARQGEPHPVTGSAVVLTVGHLNQDPRDNREANLRAMCQRCHFAHDRLQNLLTRRRRRGAPDLLDEARA